MALAHATLNPPPPPPALLNDAIDAAASFEPVQLQDGFAAAAVV